MRFLAALAFAIVATVAVACSGANESVQIHATAYNQTCHADADCVAVVSGDVCSSCSCPSGAINRADFGRYQTDLTRVENACPPSRTHIECDCVLTAVQCESSVCAVCPQPGCGDAGAR
jgi:hypothetical protein